MAKSFNSNFFYQLSNFELFRHGVEAIYKALRVKDGFFASDGLVAYWRNLGFLDDEAFVAAHKRNAVEGHEKGIIWRTATLVWAARQALKLDGDFVECGCYKGVSARIVAETVDLASTGKRFFLYDLFEHDEAMPHHAMPEHGPDLYQRTLERFADMPNVVVTKGLIPDTLANAPDKIAFMHIDMNNARGEIAALEHLFDRMPPGGVLVLDDYGQLGYRDQFDAENAWFAARGYHVLESPTGQGLVIK
ncbi:class I SAM-dependent methyltransferase [Phenylobacterium hankyongense]|uniref:Class I SAM-dependent methyltransferase n=1 Tax=Phenylobacterium hankyongense TaxID=1813876 RepID=A0A328B2A6_9CAUL|nr:class I SAM-dependent methyltransferase [Phenylobacterium hankyongense]RAK59964.1 class I SAM-dependent methyltransferase [Phenylobacterium hankyongense]